MADILTAPFPWFGGKSRIAPLVWSRFGDVSNYVEPFAGSLAVLLGRPHGSTKYETVNDRDAYLVNFWRAVQAAPDEVAVFADWPISEVDLHARHRWIVDQRGMVARLRSDPDYYDAKLAGWWVWGLSSWIGSGWCVSESRQIPNMGGRGIHSAEVAGRLPSIGNRGRGVHRSSQRGGIADYIAALSARLRSVRICCGDWARVLSPATFTVATGASAVLLDPPYASDEHSVEYSGDQLGGGDVSFGVERWAIENGDNPRLRIALCGYDGEHQMPKAWSCIAWKAVGGYGNAGDGRGRENSGRERVWFSPHCVRPPSLFDMEEEPDEVSST